MRLSSRTVAVFALVALLFVPPSSEAWGRPGHRIVARIAAKNLTADTRKKLSAIFGVSDSELESAMANAAIWPDLIDKRATATSDWHFVNVPAFSPFSVTGLCAGRNCVLDRIDEMRTRLQTNQRGFTLPARPDPPRGMTSQQLAFLIHFIGDVHQPLHAVANGDRGGNCVPLRPALRHSNGSPDTTELHAAWDVDTVLAAMKPNLGSETRTAAVLFQKFKSGSAVTQGTPLDWARESHEIAKAAIYQKLNIAALTGAPGRCATGIRPASVSQEYLADSVAIVEQRLMQAGVRLSNVLNEICKGDGCKARP